MLCFSYDTYSQLYAWLWVGQVESAGLLFKCGRDGVTGPRFGPVVTKAEFSQPCVAFIPLIIFEKEQWKMSSNGSQEGPWGREDGKVAQNTHPI